MSYVAFEKLKQHWNQPTAKKIELLPVQVLPEIPEQGFDVYQYLTERYGTKEANRKLDMAKFAAYSQDLTVDIEHMKRMPNSRLAHQAILALDNIFDQFALTQALFHAIFAHGKDIANPEVLKQIIEGMGWMAIKFYVLFNIRKSQINKLRLPIMYKVSVNTQPLTIL
jgi:predicted DsbA family dithiol-disulfide isomerase